ncbi:MAG: N-acetylmuramoyl-L-alanine amidase [Lachnospiraceae bacterium]|nr:N-acetylmuramoyl-L-alanine amidase [Lachnospiraceae bacterium]
MLFRDTSSEEGILTSGDNPDGTLLYTENAEELYEDDEVLPGKEGFFCIPIPDGTKKEDIGIDDRKMDDMTLISIPAEDPDYYYNHNLSGSKVNIKNIGFGTDNGRVIFEIHTDGVCVMTSEISDRCLYIRYDRPHDIYDRVILIDPGHGGDDSGSEAYGVREKDITLGIAQKIGNDPEKTEGIFYTRPDDSTVPLKDREEYAEKLAPDMLVTLHTNADGSTRITRGVEVYYNKDELKEKAGKLADELSKISGGTEKKVQKKKQLPGFEESDIPGIYVGAGFITNKSEAEMMASQEYEEKAAKAIEEIF